MKINNLGIVCILAMTVTLSGCQLLNDPLPQLWFFTYSNGGSTDSLLNPASFLSLHKDGTFTWDFGRFAYGTWKYENKIIYLSDKMADGIPNDNTFPVTDIGPKEMKLDLGGGKTGVFDSQPLSTARPADDPFSVQNNKWRIPPTHKESDAEIRSRLYNHCQFWETYFNWALNNELSTIDVRSTPTPIKIYGNGFTLKPVEELPGTWKACFFDEDDCSRANAMIKDIFQHRTIAWAHTDNKYKFFISAFQQMKNFLR
jgi:hypothetical protein